MLCYCGAIVEVALREVVFCGFHRLRNRLVWTERTIYVDLDIEPLFGEEKAESSMEVCYT